MRFLYNAINILGIPTQLEFAIIGIVILAGVFADESIRRIANNPCFTFLADPNDVDLKLSKRTTGNEARTAAGRHEELQVLRPRQARLQEEHESDVRQELRKVCRRSNNETSDARVYTQRRPVRLQKRF